ncbi:unnamed protein product [Vitrella brassicaformis CCMP3155]|uniref:Uncharacterized protein n=1 Tax=Vitrella brassicaformis (strain CCMP3155) TaxID=1169540 RepID=A0A0G4ERT5_VITBC|nr:unnamed protein product [Vitrella brassicaformis CCMP3155]|mmetsp:Transcript_16457/g.39487  ORF Transcript_16457/g.39487 Transcript_16457/m.39487 type:complete len:86 (-) Transcript_16457:234-491(-)|eukprot:CEM00925.1 unnamed protein product [Vitrella brassicaformis CCMP3155]
MEVDDETPAVIMKNTKPAPKLHTHEPVSDFCSAEMAKFSRSRLLIPEDLLFCLCVFHYKRQTDEKKLQLAKQQAENGCPAAMLCT